MSNLEILREKVKDALSLSGVNAQDGVENLIKSIHIDITKSTDQVERAELFSLINILNMFQQEHDVESDVFYLAVDGDDTSELIGEALKNGDAAAKHVSDSLKSVGEEILSFISEIKGDVLMSGGDGHLLTITGDSEEFMGHMGQCLINIYLNYTGKSATVGIGKTAEEAHKALTLGKNSGKNKTVIWNDKYAPYYEEVSRYLDNVKKNKIQIAIKSEEKSAYLGVISHLFSVVAATKDAKKTKKTQTHGTTEKSRKREQQKSDTAKHKAKNKAKTQPNEQQPDEQQPNAQQGDNSAVQRTIDQAAFNNASTVRELGQLARTAQNNQLYVFAHNSDIIDMNYGTSGYQLWQLKNIGNRGGKTSYTFNKHPNGKTSIVIEMAMMQKCIGAGYLKYIVSKDIPVAETVNYMDGLDIKVGSHVKYIELFDSAVNADPAAKVAQPVQGEQGAEATQAAEAVQGSGTEQASDGPAQAPAPAPEQAQDNQNQAVSPADKPALDLSKMSKHPTNMGGVVQDIKENVSMIILGGKPATLYLVEWHAPVTDKSLISVPYNRTNQPNASDSALLTDAKSRESQEILWHVKEQLEKIGDQSKLDEEVNYAHYNVAKPNPDEDYHYLRDFHNKGASLSITASPTTEERVEENAPIIAAIFDYQLNSKSISSSVINQASELFVRSVLSKTYPHETALSMFLSTLDKGNTTTLNTNIGDIQPKDMEEQPPVQLGDTEWESVINKDGTVDKQSTLKDYFYVMFYSKILPNFGNKIKKEDKKMILGVLQEYMRTKKSEVLAQIKPFYDQFYIAQYMVNAWENAVINKVKKLSPKEETLGVINHTSINPGERDPDSASTSFKVFEGDLEVPEGQETIDIAEQQEFNKNNEFAIDFVLDGIEGVVKGLSDEDIRKYKIFKYWVSNIETGQREPGISFSELAEKSQELCGQFFNERILSTYIKSTAIAIVGKILERISVNNRLPYQLVVNLEYDKNGKPVRGQDDLRAAPISLIKLIFGAMRSYYSGTFAKHSSLKFIENVFKYDLDTPQLMSDINTIRELGPLFRRNAAFYELASRYNVDLNDVEYDAFTIMEMEAQLERVGKNVEDLDLDEVFDVAKSISTNRRL